ncbi:MAG: hypothetical protein QOF55_2126 [Thermoleophilaceae bacterium]|nr:hypothetical protein [Thermoleophilaceae bacterium]MEA2457135.1 hypothetical protein [Thermoleophilaceae bacterium]
MSAVDWERVAKAVLHPLQVRILEQAAHDPEGRFSPSELASEFGVPLSIVAYHVKALHGQGLLRSAGRRARPGVMQHYYRASTALLGG